jgi:tRNA threonylcarbamoyladenosine biosynthesis protein TsaB
MSHFLVIQHTHTGIELGLFHQEKLIQKMSEDKRMASKNCVALVEQLLRANALSFHDLSFFAANQGPGPFTTLRVVISSINGLAFAAQKPLIGIDGLDALLDEYSDKNYPVTVALLNAYGNDVYFGIQSAEHTRIKGYKNIDALLTSLVEEFPSQILYFIGQAVTIHEPFIKKQCGQRAIIPTTVPEQASLEYVGCMAWDHWKQKRATVNQLLPLYLKDFVITKREPSSF